MKIFYSPCFVFMALAYPAHAQAQIETDGKSEFAVASGVSRSVLEKFFATVKKSQGARVSEDPKSANCLQGLENTEASRTRALECLTNVFESGADSRVTTSPLNEKLAIAAQELRAQLVHVRPPTAEIFRTIALLSWLDDLIRVTAERAGLPSKWLMFGKGFDPVKKDHLDFPFQHGDVVIEFGGNAASAMNSAATFPPRRFSHAYFITVENGQVGGIEAMPKNGVSLITPEDFRKKHAAEFLVLRWDNEAQRGSVAHEAIECAKAQLKKQYDGLLDTFDQTKFFCSELVAYCLARAKKKVDVDAISAEATPFNFINLDKVRPEAWPLFKYLGMEHAEYASPGSLLASPDLKFVGEFKNPAKIFSTWQALVLGEVFYSVFAEDNPRRRCLMLSDGMLRRSCAIPELMDTLLKNWQKMSSASDPASTEMRRLFPTDVRAYSLPYLFTISHSILAVAYRKVNEMLIRRGDVNLNVLSTPPWELWVLYDRVLYKDQDVASYLVKYDEKACYPDMQKICPQYYGTAPQN